MFTRPLNRGCYQPRSRCMFSFTCAWIQFRIDTYAHTRTKSLFSNSLSHTHTRPRAPPPPPEWPSRRACLCQQMSGRRCVFLCLSLHSFHPLLQRLPICLWPRFISAHSNLPPKRTPVCLLYYRKGSSNTNPPLTPPPPPPSHQSMLPSCTGTTFKIRSVRLGPGVTVRSSLMRRFRCGLPPSPGSLFP